MNKKQFYRAISKKCNITIPEARIVWRAIELVFMNAIRNKEIIKIKNFGNLDYKLYKKHIYHNPKTGEYKECEDSLVPYFSLTREFIDLARQKTDYELEMESVIDSLPDEVVEIDEDEFFETDDLETDEDS